MVRWTLLAGAIVTETAGTLALKAGLSHPAWYAVTVVGYVVSFVFLSMCLRRAMPIGVAYGIWGAVGVTLTAIMSAILFDEALTALMGLGIVLIIAGVLVVEIGSQRAERSRVRAEQSR